MSKKYNHKDLLYFLQIFSKKYNTITISKKDIDSDKNFPSSATFIRYFGSWSNALSCVDLSPGIITGRPKDKPIEISNKVLEIVNGELLGDGTISMSSSGSACFSHSTANIDYGKYLYNKLNKYNIPLLKPEILPSRNNSKIQFRTRTTTNVSWAKIYYKWYSIHNKIIPNDLTLTRETCLHWYLGDGYFEQGTSKFSTCGFSRRECEKLANMLTNLGFKSSINKRSGGYYVIRMSKKSYLSFFQWIGNCPVIGYEHRWNKGRKSDKNK